MQAVSAHREVAAEYRRERGAEDFRLPWHRSAGNIMHTPEAALFRVPLTLQRISIPARIAPKVGNARAADASIAASIAAAVSCPRKKRAIPETCLAG